MIPTLNISLDQPPQSRWLLTDEQIDWARALGMSILEEIGGVEPYRDLIELYAAEYVSESHLDEVASIARQCALTNVEILTVNLYYDFIKLLLGCTAFAVNSADGPLHARNMDWYSDYDYLSRYTVVQDFKGGHHFRAVGWPGYVGVLSGIAPGRFTITLNAALSNDPQVPGESVALLIRDVLESCPSYDAAMDRLCLTTITSDCLLMMTGTEGNQMAVIERTPTRHAVRLSEDGWLVLTNDFRMLDQPDITVDSPLYETTCHRYDAASRQIAERTPETFSDCFRILSHDQVRMGITAQQMVMSARRGDLEVRTPSADVYRLGS